MFKAPHDYRFYLELLGNASRRCGVEIHGYVLMTNHVHLSATASTATALPKMMKSIGEVYVPSFNKQYDRTGTLCEGRYRAALIEDEDYWLTCLRYIELNPVRAGLVSSPEVYPWSSYRAHAFGRHDAVLTPHPLFLTLGQTAAERQTVWQTTCGVPIGADALVTIRRATNACRPLNDVLAEGGPANSGGAHRVAGRIPASV